MEVPSGLRWVFRLFDLPLRAVIGRRVLSQNWVEFVFDQNSEAVVAHEG